MSSMSGCSIVLLDQVHKAPTPHTPFLAREEANLLKQSRQTKLSISPSMDAEPTLWIEFANPIKAEIRFYSLRNVRISWISPKMVISLCLARVLSPATVNPKPYISLEAIRSTKKHIDLVKPLPHNPSTICPTLCGIQASFPNPRTHKP